MFREGLFKFKNVRSIGFPVFSFGVMAALLMYCKKICNPVENIDFNFHASFRQINTNGCNRRWKPPRKKQNLKTITLSDEKLV